MFLRLTRFNCDFVNTFVSQTKLDNCILCSYVHQYRLPLQSVMKCANAKLLNPKVGSLFYASCCRYLGKSNSHMYTFPGY